MIKDIYVIMKYVFRVPEFDNIISGEISNQFMVRKRELGNLDFNKTGYSQWHFILFVRSSLSQLKPSIYLKKL